MTKTAHHLKIGKYKLTVFNDGKLVDPQNTFDLNCLYIEAGGRKILVDDGCGDSFQGPPGQPQTDTPGSTPGHLVENMVVEGLKPTDITDIIFTHAHIDHVSGTVDKQGIPVFPNARYTITKKEWDYLYKPLGTDEWHNFLFASACRNFPPLKDRFNLVDDNYQVMPGINFVPANGHTPGNTMVEIWSGNEHLLCIGDVAHLTRELTEPESMASLDVAPGEALKERKRIFSTAAQEGTLVFACHFDFPGLGHIREKKGVLSWEAI
jgi:glyoxylase-like metal-dependent hydrolase (beta-lactamase superfamily II)